MTCKLVYWKACLMGLFYSEYCMFSGMTFSVFCCVIIGYVVFLGTLSSCYICFYIKESADYNGMKCQCSKYPQVVRKLISWCKLKKPPFAWHSRGLDVAVTGSLLQYWSSSCVYSVAVVYEVRELWYTCCRKFLDMSIKISGSLA